MSTQDAIPSHKVGPNDLTEARLLAHWAAQIPAAVASRLVSEQQDDSHSNLGWDARHRGLFSHPLNVGPGEIAGTRIGIGFDPLSLIVEPLEGETIVHDLEGMTLADGLEKTRGLLSQSSGLPLTDLPDTPLRDYEMPQHTLATGSDFTSNNQQEALATLRSWYGYSESLFRTLATGLVAQYGAEVSTPRIWPHHFDLGLLATLDGSSPGPDSIGIGLSPGDDTFDQPYLYVAAYPWPEDNPPQSDALPEGGFWNEQGFRGSVLLGETIVEQEPDERQAFSLGFLEASVRALVPGTGS